MRYNVWGYILENISEDILCKLEDFLRKNMEMGKIYFPYEINMLISKFIIKEKILTLSEIWKREWMIFKLREMMEKRGTLIPYHNYGLWTGETCYELAR